MFKLIGRALDWGWKVCWFEPHRWAESQCCVLEQDTVHCLVLVQPRKIRPDVTEKLLTGL